MRRRTVSTYLPASSRVHPRMLLSACPSSWPFIVRSSLVDIGLAPCRGRGCEPQLPGPRHCPLSTPCPLGYCALAQLYGSRKPVSAPPTSPEERRRAGTDFLELTFIALRTLLIHKKTVGQWPVYIADLPDIRY